jgi:hypothetical protein
MENIKFYGKLECKLKFAKTFSQKRQFVKLIIQKNKLIGLK